MKNRKGFTLVELLAVIVILAVLVLLAVPSVLKMMDGAKENAFKIEAENLAKAAKMAYANDLLNDVETNLTTDGYCYSISFLKDNGYVDKNFSSSTVGSVLISNSDTEVWYYDGSKSVTKGIAGSISVDESLNTSTTDFDSCPVLTAYVSDGLKAWFDGSENTTSGHSGSATLWADLSGNNNTGNFHGAPTWGTNYLQLDGVDDDVYMGYLLYQNPTIEVVYSITGFRSTLYAAYNALAGGYSVYSTSSFIGGKAYINGAFVTAGYSTTTALNTIYSSVLTYDGSSLKSYLNGELKQSVTASGAIGAPTYSTILALGAKSYGTAVNDSWSNIKIYSFRIYDRALTLEEIQNNYTADSERFSG